MFHEAFPIMTTPDVDRALGFYRDLLGFTVTYRFPPQGEGEADYVGLELAGSQLGVGFDRTLTDVPATPRRFSICIYADDCDAAVAHLRAHGVEVLAEPADQPWGERVARVTDPDGNEVIIMARL